MSEMLVIDCPRPPSINRLWRMGRNRKTGKRIMYRSGEYVSWAAQFGLHLIEQKIRVPLARHEPFRMHVVIADRRCDLDNVDGKALLDALQHYHIIADDKQCVGRSSEYGEAPEGCRVVLIF